ncbi:F-box/WD repeat-containing protein 9 [Geodia barretti]|uniref:F-box/WD repeat-containing protein 9 n=1 Tax=Geodia barretti TaxID=519541 RepID=A0AA35TRI6_GEOBA|nr:F-box/WD repeat-containing protein 9 [Geodia barretti]
MLHLFDLPPELLEKILFYLPPTQLIVRVSATCRRLRTLLRSDSFWKRQYAALVCATPPSLSTSRGEQEASVWQRGCVEAQFSRHLGRNTVTTTTLRGPTGGVDCVHLMFPEAHGSVGLVAAGCRDSSIYLWRRRGHGAERGSRSMRGNIVYRMEGHVGWVWCLGSHRHRPELLCSGGWDSTIHVWDAVVAKMVASISKQHRAAILSLALPEPNTLVSTTYDKRVKEFDLRMPPSLVAEHMSTEHQFWPSPVPTATSTPEERTGVCVSGTEDLTKYCRL